jgi:hypothetical protein
MVESKTHTPNPEGMVQKVREWIGSPSFYAAVERHTAIIPDFSIVALSAFERDPILRTLHIAYGYAKLGGKLLPLRITISYVDVTVRIGLLKIVIPLEEVEE